ncbi:hypothetical protein SLEP1_g51065 [Rubroshorea leprosula]|uniref:Uncharacterized protein n=1 Tax=Rubroshorea leprosula TaxID=152421 RepID=A0AAV5M2V0_9ROSI|nr:hypothetical protein SLEP1_g51065 [Rubroshorea leprosula]
MVQVTASWVVSSVTKAALDKAVKHATDRISFAWGFEGGAGRSCPLPYPGCSSA